MGGAALTLVRGRLRRLFGSTTHNGLDGAFRSPSAVSVAGELFRSSRLFRESLRDKASKPQSTELGHVRGLLKKQEGAPLNLG